MVCACLVWCIMYIRRGRATYPRRKKRRRRYLSGLGDVTAWRKSWNWTGWTYLISSGKKKKKSGEFILGAFTFYPPNKVHLWPHWSKSPLSFFFFFVFLFSFLPFSCCFELKVEMCRNHCGAILKKKFWVSPFKIWSPLVGLFK